MTESFDKHIDDVLDALLRDAARVGAADALAAMHATLARHGLDVAAQASSRIAALFEVARTRVDAEEAHERTRERMDMLSTASFEGLFVHVDNAIVDANERLAEMLGYSRAELLGGETFGRCVAPEDQAATALRVAGRVEGDYVITAVRKDGTRFRAELQAKQGQLGERPVRVVAVRDVTERERRKALLHESEQRLRELADATFDLAISSRDGEIIDVRGPVESMTGHARESLIGRITAEFVTPDEQARVKQLVAARQVGRYETSLVAVNGELVPVEVTAIESTLDGQPIRLAGLRDLRPQKRLEAERERLAQQAEQSQRLDSLGVLAGGIAHDFNNLLVGIQGNAEDLLARMHDEGEAGQALQAIMLAAQRAATLTSQMLAYAGQREPRRREPIDLLALVGELRTLLGASLSKKAQVDFIVPRGLVVLGDRTTLSQVLMNLLTNASDALGDEVGRIGVEATHVRAPDPHWYHALGASIDASAHGWIQISVSDTGEGMDAARRARVFEPFFTTKKSGHGLGLAASVGIVRAHDGAIHVESQVGRGSTFSVLLPACEDDAIVHPPTVTPASSARPEGPRRLLVVDDEHHIRGFVKRLLQRYGFEVTTAGRGEEALALVQRERFDVVLLDLTMPDLSGLQVLERLRASGATMPVILSSGYLSAGVDAGRFQGFLQKPFRVAELLEQIERALADDVTPS